MKKTFFGLAAASLIIAACSVEETPSGISLEQKQITIQAVAGEAPTDDATRSIRLDNGDIWWTPGDQISVFYGSGADGGSCFTAQIEENKKVANFTGTIGVITGGGDISVDQTFFWGVYPYNDTAICDGTTIVTDVPDCQTAVAGTFAPGVYPWIGRSQGLLMSFYGLCGGIKFSVNKEGIKKATLKTADGSPIAGRVRIALDANGIPSVQEVIEGKDEVVLEAPDGEYFIPGKYYFFVTLPHNFNTSFFTVKFETFTEEGTYERKRALEIKRADFIAFGSALDGSVTYEKKTGAIPVEDAAFKAYLVNNFDTDGDGEISFEEAENVHEVHMNPTNAYNLKSLRGIEYMPNLEVIDCPGEWYDSGNKAEGIDREYYYVGPYKDNWDYAWGPIGTLQYVDVSSNPKLRILNVENNSSLGVTMGTLKTSNNPLLEEIHLGMTWLSYPDISKNSELTKIGLSHLRGEVPDLSQLNKVTDLVLEYPQDQEVEYVDLDVSHMPELTVLYANAKIKSISNLSSNPKLRELYINYCHELNGAIDVSENPALEVLECNSTNLENLDLTNCSSLRRLKCEDNHLLSIDLSNNSSLEYLDCRRNLLSTLDVSNNPLLEELYCAPMKGDDGNNILSVLYVSENQTIPFITENRDEEHIPADTEIRIVSGGGGGDDPSTISLNVGDIIDSDGLGIVCWVSDDKQSALLMSVTELQNKNWQTSNNWCKAYGDSWEMPTIDELTEIHSNFDLINARLSENGYTILTTNNKCYWSSTVNPKDNRYYYRERLYDGSVFTNLGNDENYSSTANYTRAIKWIDGNSYDQVIIPVESISIEEQELTLLIGETRTIPVSYYPANATNTTTTWESSNPEIASIDDNGIVTALSAGVATIYARNGSISAECTVVVSSQMIEIQSISLNMTSATIGEGETLQLSATVNPAEASVPITWSSSNLDVAVVEETGRVRAKSSGTATITATAEGKSAMCIVTVKRVSVTGVSLDKTSVSISETYYGQLRATIQPENATNQSVTWSSSNTSVATVDKNGLVYGVFAGTATITVKTNDGGFKATCSVKIRDVTEPNSVLLETTTLNLYEGRKKKLNYTILPYSAGDKTVIWSSSNTSVATVDHLDGTITAISPGNAIITAKANTGGALGKCSLTVLAAPSPEPVDLGLSVKWANQNIGALAPEDYGSYFAWGETKPKGKYEWGCYKWGAYSGAGTSQVTKYGNDGRGGTWYPDSNPDGKSVLEKEDDPAYAYLGGSWRTPSKAEWEELIKNCSFTITTSNNVKGYLIRSKVEGYTDAFIFLPFAGSRGAEGTLIGGGNTVLSWTRQLYSDNIYTYPLNARSYAGGVDSDCVAAKALSRELGATVRAVCD